MNEIQTRQSEAKNFFQLYNNTLGDDASSQIETLRKVLKSSVSEKLKKSIQAEIDDFEQKDSSLMNQRMELFCETMKYVWNHPEKEKLLLITKKEYQNSYRSDNGAYDVIAYYDFNGELGELVNIVSDFGDTGEVYFNHEKREKIDFSNKLTYEKFKKVFLENFADSPDSFKDCFKKIDSKN